MNFADTTVLIPAAGRVPDGLLALSNITCPAMIPVGGRPVVHWTISYLRSLGIRRFIIAVARRGMFVEDFVDAAFGQDCDVSFIVPSVDGGVGRTVLELAERVETSAALVVLGDTHFQLREETLAGPSDESFVLTSSVSDSYRWCVARRDERGYLQELVDKQPNLEGELEALIGVYYFASAEQLREAARSTVDLAERAAARRAEMAGILTYVNKVSRIRVEAAGSWLDCGNPDMQARSHQALLQARAFNELSIDATLGTITKRSRHTEKFIDEINYLRLLPADLSVLFPRVIGFSTDWSDPWVELEYYGYPNLSEVFLFEHVDPGVWERIFLHLRQLLRERFGRYQRPLERALVTDMYLGKTQRRLDHARTSHDLAAMLTSSRDVIVSGRPLRNLRALWPEIERAVGGLAASAVGSVIHGDLCLPNILYDLRSRICKLIDPRGSFGVVGIYGDPRYDVAKLWHSVHGLYDLIVNDLFHVSTGDHRIDLRIRASGNHREVEQRFTRVFFGPQGYRREEVQLISALLFASMIALHEDRPLRQAAMYGRALQLFDEYFGSATP